MNRPSKQGLGLALLLLLASFTALWADDQPKAAANVVVCRASLACLQQMVDDLRDYRQYLEDQLSLAKSVLTQANQTIAAQAREIEALKAAMQPADKPKEGKP